MGGRAASRRTRAKTSWRARVAAAASSAATGPSGPRRRRPAGRCLRQGVEALLGEPLGRQVEDGTALDRAGRVCRVCRVCCVCRVCRHQQDGASARVAEPVSAASSGTVAGAGAVGPVAWAGAGAASRQTRVSVVGTTAGARPAAAGVPPVAAGATAAAAGRGAAAGAVGPTALRVIRSSSRSTSPAGCRPRPGCARRPRTRHRWRPRRVRPAPPGRSPCRRSGGGPPTARRTRAGTPRPSRRRACRAPGRRCRAAAAVRTGALPAARALLGAEHQQHAAGAPVRRPDDPVGGPVRDAARVPPGRHVRQRDPLRAARPEPGHVDVAGRRERCAGHAGGAVLDRPFAGRGRYGADRVPAVPGLRHSMPASGPGTVSGVLNASCSSLHTRSGRSASPAESSASICTAAGTTGRRRSGGRRPADRRP